MRLLNSLLNAGPAIASKFRSVQLPTEAYDLQATEDYASESLEEGPSPAKENGRQRFLLVFIAIFVLAIPITFFADISQTPLIDVHTLPNLESVKRYEDVLPQHNARTAASTRYVLFLSQHHWGEGYNNAWEEFILLHEVALRANRSYAFRPLVFADHTVWPANTFMSGPTAGGPWPSGVDAPRAISMSWWDTACPPDRLRTIRADDVWNELKLVKESDGEDIVSKWGKYLKELSDPCVAVDGRGFFDLDFWFGVPERAVAIWPTLSKSPILTHHAWSKHVYNAVSRNLPLLTGNKLTDENEKYPHASDSAASSPPPPPLRAYKEMTNVIALHIRRGDYEGHCWALAGFALPYASWNVLSGLPDRFKPDKSTEDAKKAAIPHCLPDAKTIAARVAAANKDYIVARGVKADKLEYIYIMTNAKEDFLSEVRKELESVGFPHVITAKDLKLNEMENYANMIVDMEIGIRAALFIGNGFSTLTSTVVALRLIREAPLFTNRFW
ncbi:hypothetical protein AURDEDRAFT_179387 [Auricularia subglabra TFB-10046 SS5]|nr:hypothetical protein AURDEDRAFT_179387 [Auricularia subglabra TFB-10046 SS5]